MVATPNPPLEGELTDPIITLTSDFGLQDYYVGAMKGVIARIAPRAHVIDISHDIGAQNVAHGAFVLHYAAREFPPTTVHCAIVDPGVGSARRALAFTSATHLWVGPDNGLLSFAFNQVEGSIYAIDSTRLPPVRKSATFHGRDLFAPAAARLSDGVPLDEIGTPITDPILLPSATCQLGDDFVEGHIIHIDQFGNLVSNIPRHVLDKLGEDPSIRVGSTARINGLNTTYADVAPGQLLALIGSADLVEISVNQGHAARQLGIELGAPIRIELSHT